MALSLEELKKEPDKQIVTASKCGFQREPSNALLCSMASPAFTLGAALTISGLQRTPVLIDTLIKQEKMKT